MKFKLFLLLGSVLILGCGAQPLRQERMVTQITGSQSSGSVFNKAIYVQFASNAPNNLELALVSSLKLQGWAAVTSNTADYILGARVISEVPPTAGMTMEGSLSVSYSLSRKFDGKVVYSDVVYSQSKLGLTDSLIGRNRMTMVKEEYVKENISSLLYRLQAVARTENGLLLRAKILANASNDFRSYDFKGAKSFFETGYYSGLTKPERMQVLSDTRATWYPSISGRGLSRNFIAQYGEYMDPADVQSLRAQARDSTQQRPEQEKAAEVNRDRPKQPANDQGGSRPNPF